MNKYFVVFAWTGGEKDLRYIRLTILDARKVAEKIKNFDIEIYQNDELIDVEFYRNFKREIN